LQDQLLRYINSTPFMEGSTHYRPVIFTVPLHHHDNGLIPVYRSLLPNRPGVYDLMYFKWDMYEYLQHGR